MQGSVDVLHPIAADGGPEPEVSDVVGVDRTVRQAEVDVVDLLVRQTVVVQGHDEGGGDKDHDSREHDEDEHHTEIVARANVSRGLGV